MRASTLIGLASFVMVGCASAPRLAESHSPRPHPEAPSFDELARVDPPAGARAMVVMYPRSACSGSARVVVIDEAGRYLGSLAPGDASILTISKSATTVLAFSSVEVTAPPGTWSRIEEIALRPPMDGIVFTALRADARKCGNGQYTSASIETRRELEARLVDTDLRWVDPQVVEGQRWLDTHRARIVEIRDGRPSQRLGVLTRTRIP